MRRTRSGGVGVARVPSRLVELLVRNVDSRPSLRGASSRSALSDRAPGRGVASVDVRVARDVLSQVVRNADHAQAYFRFAYLAPLSPSRVVTLLLVAHLEIARDVPAATHSKGVLRANRRRDLLGLAFGDAPGVPGSGLATLSSREGPRCPGVPKV